MSWINTIKRRMFGNTPVYDGTGMGRRALKWNPGNPGAVSALALTQDQLRTKSRDLVRRNQAKGLRKTVVGGLGFLTPPSIWRTSGASSTTKMLRRGLDIEGSLDLVSVGLQYMAAAFC